MLKVTSTTTTYKCPKCGYVVKKKWDSDALTLIYVFLFIPVGLIALLVHFLNKITMDKTDMGEELRTCSHCNSKVAINPFGTRLYKTPNDVLDNMRPLLNELSKEFNLFIGKYDNKDLNFKYSKDLLFLLFRNKETNKECRIAFGYDMSGELNMFLIGKIDEGSSKFSIEKLISIVSILGEND